MFIARLVAIIMDMLSIFQVLDHEHGSRYAVRFETKLRELAEIYPIEAKKYNLK